jgi:hypothetical protein
MPKAPEVDREAEALDDVMADRLATIKCTPRRVVSAGQDVRFQSVDRLAVAETKQVVVHRWTINRSEEGDLTATARR